MKKSPLDALIRFCLENKIVVFLALILMMGWGVMVAPFDWDMFGELRDPVPVDAIPDIGENQQIVFTDWPGRSPQDVEDQISYPLTVSLLGIPDVKSIRSFSMMGFSTIYVIFKEGVDFYWSRSRILEKLNSLSPGTLPDGLRPSLGPDATALGQVFWYTLEGRDENANPTGGWDLHELRSIQDYIVRYGLMSAEGISEVASVGGFVQEYQIDVDPNAMLSYDVSLSEVMNAVRMANIDVGARTIDINNVEYVIRGIGFVKSLQDIENAVVKTNDNAPIFVKNIANVTLGPALRRGVLDKGGVEVVGGVAVVRYGSNPLKAIQNVKLKIAEISPGLPQKILADGRTSQVTIVPFYDRTGLIYETLGTLESALSQQILITVIVVILLVMHFKSSILISGLLPLAVLMSFIGMKIFGVDANIVALSGIAIAIGTMVDMGIVITENIVNHLQVADEKESKLEVIYRASTEVGGAVLTAVSTTVISFLPVFTLQAAEGKLFKPLAFTKTFALIASVIIALTVIPPFAHLLFSLTIKKVRAKFLLYAFFVLLGIYVAANWSFLGGLIIVVLSALGLVRFFVNIKWQEKIAKITNLTIVGLVIIFLSKNWMPLGAGQNLFLNILFVTLLIAGFLFFFQTVQKVYPRILRWALANKIKFLTAPMIVIFFGLLAWMGFDTLFGWVPQPIRNIKPITSVTHTFPGLGKEFMPSLDEGSYLYMPTTMPHASIGEVSDVLRKQDMAIQALPEIENVVGKLGRIDSPLDPAPISMIETVINYRSEYKLDDRGKILKYEFDSDSVNFALDEFGEKVLAADGLPYKVKGVFLLDKYGKLVPHKRGKPFRYWRKSLDLDLNPGREPWAGVNSPDDIWKEIVRVAKILGTTSAPKLQPIEARIVMLQSGMRAPMGVKVKGPTLESIETVALDIERFLKEVSSVRSETVQADRVVGKPYLEIHINREKIARYGIKLLTVQNVVEVAIGGKPISRTVEGRERYPIRVRYPRELRNTIEGIESILVTAPNRAQIPLKQLSEIKYVRGPQMIKSEDTFLTGYVIFDKKTEFAEVDVVQQAQEYLDYKIEMGELKIPAGVSFKFAGSYENQVRAQNRLKIVLPLSLFVIFMILYFKFRSIKTTTLIFTGIAVAWSGGFILLWLYGQPWFMDVSLFGANLRDLFQISPINLSVAVWVGFLALFGIATDDGVLIATYLDQSFAKRKPITVGEVREATVQAGLKRVRPMLMTTATTVLALLPVLTSSGRGSDIMIPMAIPAFGGMLVAIVTMFVVPVLYSMIHERKLIKK
jgi:copper/silver efflux system protein